MKKNTKKIFLSILAIITIIALIAFAVQNLFGQDNSKTTNTNSNQSKKQNTKIIEGEAKSILEIGETDVVLGNKSAPLTVIEYASLSCPHCATFYSDGFPKLKEEYIATGKVNFIYRDFPLNQPALIAGMVALCQVKDKEADAEKYYDFIKVLFKTQESWAFSPEFGNKLETIAKLDGMSSEKFSSCIKDAKLQDSILKARMAAVQSLQIQSTPTFFVGSEMMSGYGGYGEIKAAIERKLSEIGSVNSVSNSTSNLPNNSK